MSTDLHNLTFARSLNDTSLTHHSLYPTTSAVCNQYYVSLLASIVWTKLVTLVLCWHPTLSELPRSLLGTKGMLQPHQVHLVLDDIMGLFFTAINGVGWELLSKQPPTAGSIAFDVSSGELQGTADLCFVKSQRVTDLLNSTEMLNQT